MVINQKSWHYRLYKWTYYALSGNQPPTETNLCQYVQRIFWMTLFAGFMVTIFAPIYYLIATPLVFLFGHRPKNMFTGEPGFVEYKSWWHIGDLEVVPFHVILVGLLGLLEWWGWRRHLKGTAWGHGIVIGLIAVVFSILFLCYDNSETTRLLRAWVSAKKRRVCPLIEFKDEPTSEA